LKVVSQELNVDAAEGLRDPAPAGHHVAQGRWLVADAAAGLGQSVPKVVDFDERR